MWWTLIGSFDKFSQSTYVLQLSLFFVSNKMASKRPLHEALSSKSATKKPKATQKFTDKYLKILGISRSSLGDSYAHCDYCKCDFSIAHSGSFDIQGHLKTKKHTNYLSLARDAKAVNQPKLNMFMPSSSSTLSAVDRDIIRAEVMVPESLVKMNASLSSADVFTDTNIAQGYSCCRNKTTAIINSMAEKEKDDIAGCEVYAWGDLG